MGRKHEQIHKTIISEFDSEYAMQTTEKIVTISPLAIERVKEFMAKDDAQANG